MIQKPYSSRLQSSLLAGLVFLHWMAIQPLATAADSPLFIPFQGQVTNQAGTVVSDGQYSVIFNLYDQAVGGQPVWSERHVRIGVTRGMINVFLGSISPLANVDFSQTKYLGITVDNDNLATTADPEMVPRSLIIPAFHAKKAELASNSLKLAGYDWTPLLTNGSNDPSTGKLRGDKIADSSIGGSQISNGSISTVKLASGAINYGIIAQRTAGTTVPLGGFATSDPVDHGDVNLPLAGRTFTSPNHKVTLTTKGGPVLLFLSGSTIEAVSGSTTNVSIRFRRNGTQQVEGNVLFRWQGRGNMAPGAVLQIDRPAAGTHTYEVDFTASAENGAIVSSFGMTMVRLNAVEL